jgi:uncharacterized protein YbjT (DUF2867 family)
MGGVRIAVAGGTGVVGRPLVDELAQRGHEIVVLARSHGVDVESGAGVAEALSGADVVVDVTSVPTLSRKRAVRFFEAGTRNLTETGRLAGVAHHVVLSIVGIDRVPGFGYYAGKLRQEQLALSGPVPSTVLRATQFHDFPVQLLARTRGPVAPVPRMRSRPVDVTEVASALADLAVGPARGRAGEIAGPEVLEIIDMARRVAVGRRVVGFRLPGPAGRALAAGALLPQEPGTPVLQGRITFDEWVASRPSRPPDEPMGR